MDITVLGKEPISPDKPAGSDVRYEPEFEQLQAEVDKISIPSASGGIDWKKVSNLAVTILGEKSKDLLVACYLAVSQIHIRQLDGLADGLTVLHDLVKTHWDGLYPPKKRMRGRLGAIEWWIEKSEVALSSIKPDPVPVETMDGLKNTLSQIDTMLQEYLPDPPLLRPIQRMLERIPTQAPKKPEPVSSSDVEAPTPSPAKPGPELKEKESPRAGDTTAINTAQDAKKMLSESFQKVRQAAAFLLEENQANPLVYRYRRLTAWTQVLDLPPASEGKTQIPPPATQVLQTLTDLKDKGQWKALIINAEQKLSQFIFWFDLNRLVAEALLELGDEYQDAYSTVCHETAAFVSRLPDLLDLTFSDGTPFTDFETRQWLNGIRTYSDSVKKDSKPSKKTGKNKDDADPILQIQGKAEALAKKKKWSEAVGLFQMELKSCSSQKEAMTWRIALCRMLFRSKQVDMTIPHLDLIIKDIDSHGLENWDPELALEGLKLAWTVFSKQTDPALKADAKAIFSRIAILDPVEALKLGGT